MGMCGLGLVLKNNLIDTKVNDSSANMNHLLRECMKNRAIKLSRVHLANQYLFYRNSHYCLITFAGRVIVNVTLYSIFRLFSNSLSPLPVSESLSLSLLPPPISSCLVIS